MTAFALTEQQRAFAGQVRSMAAEQLRPIAEAGPPGHVNRELIKAMGELGLLGRLFPGITGDAVSREAAATDLCLLRESLATQSTEAETALALQGLGAYPILQSGQEDTVRRWLPAIAAGDAVAAFALTEPEAGSDAAALSLRAEPDGDEWRLTGEKTWISNAPEADVYTVFARTTPGAGARGVSAFAVPGDRAGLHGEHLDMISPHPIGSLVFDGVRVDRTELLGSHRPDLAGEGPLLLGQRERGHRAGPAVVAVSAVRAAPAVAAVSAVVAVSAVAAFSAVTAAAAGRQRACAVPGVPARISSSRGLGPSVRPPWGRRRPAANGSGQTAPGPVYSCSAAACRVHCGSYRWVRPSAHRSARPARMIEFTSS